MYLGLTSWDQKTDQGVLSLEKTDSPLINSHVQTRCHWPGTLQCKTVALKPTFMFQQAASVTSAITICPKRSHGGLVRALPVPTYTIQNRNRIQWRAVRHQELSYTRMPVWRV